jgi:hypothetical protein
MLFPSAKAGTSHNQASRVQRQLPLQLAFAAYWRMMR